MSGVLGDSSEDTMASGPPVAGFGQDPERLAAAAAELQDDPRHRFGRYVIFDEIGRGAMGIVHRAWDPELRRAVALKVLTPGPQVTPRDIERFRREARSAARLQHPNIISVFDVGQIDGQPYFTMAYVEGVSLLEQIVLGIGVEEAVRLISKVARATDFAHREGVVHRDIKPTNIMIDGEGAPWLADFGLALDASSSRDGRLTTEGTTVGTPLYMSPEAAKALPGGDAPTSDIYSLAAVLYHAVTGRPPFEGPSAVEIMTKVVRDPPVLPSALNPAVPLSLEKVILHGLEKMVVRRYPTASELADDLDRWLEGKPPKLSSGRLVAANRGAAIADRSAVNPGRPFVAVALTSLVLAAAIVAGVSWFALRARDERSGRPIDPPTTDARARLLAPELTLEGLPERVRTEDASILVRGTVSKKGCVVRVRGELVDCPGGAFEAPARLEVGVNDIEVIATDDRGLTDRVVVTVTYDLPPPKLPAIEPWWTPTPEQLAEADRTGLPLAIQNDWGMRFVLVPSGTFAMGVERDDPFYEEGTDRHEVTITRPYYLARTELTNAQARIIWPNHSLAAFLGFSIDREAQPTLLTWREAEDYCGELSDLDAALDYRLPTEAEWERAAKLGGIETRIWADGGRDAGRWANLIDRTMRDQWNHPSIVWNEGEVDWGMFDTDDGAFVSADVASYGADALGLHDMIGNHWEWCADRYHPYAPAAATDPRGPLAGRERVFRGGSWYDYGSMARASHRGKHVPDELLEDVGVRLVAVPPTR